MEYRLFGKSGLAVSCIGYGCMTFGDPSIGNMSQQETEDMVRVASIRTCPPTRAVEAPPHPVGGLCPGSAVRASVHQRALPAPLPRSAPLRITPSRAPRVTARAPSPRPPPLPLHCASYAAPAHHCVNPHPSGRGDHALARARAQRGGGRHSRTQQLTPCMAAIQPPLSPTPR